MLTYLSMTETLEGFMVGEKFTSYYLKVTIHYHCLIKKDFLAYLIPEKLR